MKHAQGAVCKSRDGSHIVAVYNYYGDVFSSPSPDMGGLERLAHVSYFKGGIQKSVDYFKLKGNTQIPETINENKIIENTGKYITIVNTGYKQEKDYLDKAKKSQGKESKGELFEKRVIKYEPQIGKQITPFIFKREDLEKVDKRYNIEYQIVNLPKTQLGEIIDFARADIFAFCGEKVGPYLDNSNRIKIVNEIEAKTKIIRITPSQYLRGGKQWFTPECLLEANIDFSKGCLTGIAPMGIWRIEGDFTYNLFSQPYAECEYCYAEKKHKNFLKTIYKFDPKILEEELRGKAKLSFKYPKQEIGSLVKIVRFGKRTETWTPFTQNEFIGTLEVFARTGTSAIIPTKFLPYIPEVADLSKRTKSTLLYSVGEFEEFEPGTLNWRASNQFRLDQALKYREAGVNADLYMMILGHHSPSERDLEILKFADFGNRIPIQLLPMRFDSKSLVKKMSGDKWEELIGKGKVNPNRLFPEIYDYQGSYVSKGNALLLKRFDPFWINLVKSSNGKIRICHHDDEKVYCGRCFQDKEKD